MSEKATLAGGCFWCLDAVYREIEGVKSIVSGYTGGTVPNPTYEQVCSGRTGHAEAVQIEFDPGVVAYPDLLRIFFTIHDPTTKDRQGNDIGTQYRSAIYWSGEEQRRAAQDVMAEITKSGIWGAPLVTELEPLGVFYPAEGYHQDYFSNNPDQPYCRAIVAPKVAKARKAFRDRLRRSG